MAAPERRRGGSWGKRKRNHEEKDEEGEEGEQEEGLSTAQLLQPQLLPKDALLEELARRGAGELATAALDKEDLLQLFQRLVSPLPQRHYRSNRTGAHLNQLQAKRRKRNESSSSSPSSSAPSSSSSLERLHLRHKRFASHTEPKPHANPVEANNSHSPAKRKSPCKEAKEQETSEPKKRRMITWP